MIGLKSMIGFKSIDEMSLNECYAFLKKETPESSGYYGIVKIRYEQLAELTRLQEEKEYKSCKSVADFDRFINKYDKMKPEYQPIHLDDARKMKKRLEEFNARTEAERQQREQREAAERRRRRKIVIASVAGILLVVAIATFFIGYRPVKTLSADNVTFGKEGGEKIVRIETNVSANEIEITEPEKDWVRVALERKTLTISAEENPNPERTCKMTIKAYSTFFGERTGTELSIEILISQNSGYAINDLNVSSRGFSIGKYGGSERVNIKTDGVALEVVPAKNCSDWISVNVKRQNHDTHFYHDDDYEINVEKNPAGDRTGKVIVSTGGQPSQEIVINQASGLANKFSVSTHSIGPVSKSGTKEGYCYPVDITTDGTTWEASTSCRWLILNKNNNCLEIEVRPADEVRDGEVYVSSNNGHRETISIHQDGDPTSFYFSRSSLTFDTDSDYEYVSFTNNSNQSVEVSTNKSWLEASVYSGNKVRVSCESNNNSPQDGVVTLSCGRKKTQIKVHQYGYKRVACSNCLDLWGYPTGTEIEYLPYYPWTRIVNCRKCGGRKYLKQKAYYN